MLIIFRVLYGASGIHKTGLGSQKHHQRSIFIDLANIWKCKCNSIGFFFEFPWFRGYEKDVKRYLELICPRILAWALFWTCLVKETMFPKYWQLFVRRQAWKSKSIFFILAASGLQDFKGPMSFLFVITLYTYTSVNPCNPCTEQSKAEQSYPVFEQLFSNALFDS